MMATKQLDDDGNVSEDNSEDNRVIFEAITISQERGQ